VQLDLTLSIITSRKVSQINFLLDSLECLKFTVKKIIIIYSPNAILNEDFPENIKRIENLELISYDGGGKQPAMRNLALSACKTPYIWFVDDDVRIPNFTIKKLRKLILLFDLSPELAFASGKIIEKRKKNLKKLISKPLIHPLFGLNFPFGVNPEFLIRKGYRSLNFNDQIFPYISFPQGTSMLFRTSSLKSIGGFNVDLYSGYASYEDSEPGLLLTKFNYFGIYTDLITVHHYKLPRVNSVGRESISSKYLIGLVRNYRRTLVFNKIPNKFSFTMFYFSHSFYIFIKIFYSLFQSFTFSKVIMIIDILLKLLVEIFFGYLIDLYKLISKKNYRSEFVDKTKV
tara:strand:+ start:22280 stop:23311 length:1032 start_codon:yes stop_codon:yes gene_type:complete